MTSKLPFSITKRRLYAALSAGLLVAGVAFVFEGFTLQPSAHDEVVTVKLQTGGKEAAPEFLTNSTALYVAEDDTADQAMMSSGGWIESLHALSAFGGTDSDSDGLPDAFEQVLQTELDDRDTDADGFEDFEERARGTNLHDPLDVPTAPEPAKLNLIAHSTAQDLVVGATMYFGSGLGGRYKVRVGVSSGGRIALLPLSYLGEISEISDVSRSIVGSGPGYEAGADLRFMEVCLPRRLLDGGRHLCVFAYIVDTITAQVVASEKIDLFSTMDGGIVAEENINSMPPATPGSQAPTSGSIYIPLGGGNGPTDVPTTWKPLRVCLKSSTVVGTAGSLVTREVVRASCVAGYDGYCPSTCPSSVGSTYQTIDPLTFVSE